jgi:hypothetical protein
MHEFYSHNLVDSIKMLWSNPEYADELIVQPEQHFADKGMKSWMYHDMHTSDWWWKTQVSSSLL